MDATGDRVVLGRKEKTMIGFRFTGNEPTEMSDVDEALELGAQWEGDELVTYDLPGITELYQYYRTDDYMSDND